MPLYTCAIPNCEKPGFRDGDGTCYLCNKHFCFDHLDEPSRHTCPTFEDDETAYKTLQNRSLKDEIGAIFAVVDRDALAKRASELRSGVPCSVPPLSPASDLKVPMGGMNIHILVTFDDGVEWICRIRRRNASTPPVALLDQFVSSEAATLKFLSSKGLPVPRVYDVVVPSKPTSVGVGYILMEKISGQVMEWHSMDVSSKTKVLEQLADIQASLSLHSFPAIGCLQEDASVASIVSEHAADFEDGTLRMLGPYKSATEYYESVVYHHIAQVVNRESHSNSTDAYLVYREVLDIIPLISPRRSSPLFYLKHMDDKGDHILVDDEFNITGIIDWEWAQTVPKAEAFAAPMFLVDIGAYYDGEDALSADEELFASILERKGHEELASYVRRGRVWHRLAHTLDAMTAPEDLPVHFGRLRTETQGIEQSWEDWKVGVLKKYKLDPALIALLKPSEKD